MSVQCHPKGRLPRRMASVTLEYVPPFAQCVQLQATTPPAWPHDMPRQQQHSKRNFCWPHAKSKAAHIVAFSESFAPTALRHQRHQHR